MGDSTTTYTSPPTSSSYLTPTEAANHRANPAVSPVRPSNNDKPQEQQLDLSESQRTNPFQNLNLPKVIWHLNPSVLLKLRKRFYPLGLTCLTLGADYDMREHNFSFKWSWKDRIIGGRLEFYDDQISLTKRFEIDKRTHLDLRTAFDIRTRRTLFSLKIKPFHGIVAHDRPPQGLSIKQEIPLDKRLSLQVAGRLSVPEARFGNETTSAVSLGDGDFVFDLEQLNFRFLVE